MGVKTALLAYTDGNPGAVLSTSPVSDRDAARELLRTMLPCRAVDDIGDDVLYRAWYPPDERVAYVGVFPGLRIVGSRLFAADYPSALSSQVLDAAAGRDVHLHSFHSVSDRLSFAVWRDRTLVRSLSLGDERGQVLEDIGDRLAFETSYWAGEHADYDGAYAVPFHPGELGDDALAELFGFRGEGGPTRNPYPVDSEAVVLNGFRLGDIGSAGAKGVRCLAYTENHAVWSDPTPDRVRQLVADLGPGNRFLICEVHRDLIDNPDVAYYIQTYRHTDEGRYDVEYRVGTADQHYATTMDTAEEVARALSGWAAHDMDWVDERKWTRPFA